MEKNEETEANERGRRWTKAKRRRKCDNGSGGRETQREGWKKLIKEIERGEGKQRERMK